MVKKKSKVIYERNVNIMEYSGKEIALARHFGYEDLCLSGGTDADNIYRILAVHCFMSNLEGPEVDSVRRCMKAMLIRNPKRLTSEFEALISFEKTAHPNRLKEVFVDFDGTICPSKNDVDYAPPTEACLRSLKKFKDLGYSIVIYSVRSNKNETFKNNGHAEMINYLSQHGILFDRIETSKKHFAYIVDDKALGQLDKNGNVDWNVVLEHLGKKNT